MSSTHSALPGPVGPVLATALLAVLSGVLVAGCSPREEPPTPPARTPAPQGNPSRLQYPTGAAQLEMIRTQTIAWSPVPLGDVLSARVAYDEDRTARIAVSYAGRIVALKVAPGDAVKAGQVLAVIDSPDVGSALADRDKARADEERKRRLSERARDLVTGDAVSQRDWESLQADLDVAHAETLRATQRLRNLNPGGAALPGQRVPLVSPIAGTVAERSATPALEVAPGGAAPLFVVSDTTRLWLLIDVPEKLLGSLRSGDKVEVESDAYPGERFAARLVQTSLAIDVNTRRATARAMLDNPARKLLPEMFVRARVLRGDGLAARVPNSALVNHGLYSYLFVETATGEFERRQVALLTQGGDDSVVASGLRRGESVVTRGALLLDADMTAHAAETR